MKEDPNVSRLVVGFLRFSKGMTQTAFSKASGVSQGHISRYESGQKVPTEKILRRLAQAVDVAWPKVGHLQRFCAGFVADSPKETPTNRPGSQTSDVEALKRAILEPALLAVSAYLLEEEA